MCLIKYQLIGKEIIDGCIINKNDFDKVIYLEFNTNINNIFLYYPNINKMLNVRKIVCTKSIGNFTLPTQLANLLKLSELIIHNSYEEFSSPQKYEWIKINNLCLNNKIIISSNYNINDTDLYYQIEYMNIIGINDMSIEWCKQNLVNLPQTLIYLHMPLNSSIINNIDLLSNIPFSLKELSLAIPTEYQYKDQNYIKKIIDKLKLPFDCVCTYFYI